MLLRGAIQYHNHSLQLLLLSVMRFLFHGRADLAVCRAEQKHLSMVVRHTFPLHVSRVR